MPSGIALISVRAMLLVNWLVAEICLEQCKAEPCVRLTTRDEVALMVEVHVDDIIVSGGKNVCENFFAQPEGTIFRKKERETKDVHRLCFRSRLGIRRVKR